MWVPKPLVELFQISKDNVSSLREELAAVKAERDTLKHQLVVANTNFDWARIKLNQLEFEKAALFEKVTGAKIPAAELVKTMSQEATVDFDRMIGFDDMGDKLAKRFGLELHDVRPLPGEGN